VTSDTGTKKTDVWDIYIARQSGLLQPLQGSVPHHIIFEERPLGEQTVLVGHMESKLSTFSRPCICMWARFTFRGNNTIQTGTKADAGAVGLLLFTDHAQVIDVLRVVVTDGWAAATVGGAAGGGSGSVAQ
jgi:hypothetical protein